MIPRIAAASLMQFARTFKALAVTGPRQSGKTTLVRTLFKEKAYVSLENPDTLLFSKDDPRGFLQSYPSGLIIDEAQRNPELFSYLQEYIDARTDKGVYILTGSNNFLLQQQISQSLAGRVAYLELLPFSLPELGSSFADNKSDSQLLFDGFYPPVHDQHIPPEDWYPQYIRTYIERDIRQLKNIGNLFLFDRFVRLLAGRNAQELNFTAISIEAGIDTKTVQSWIGLLQAAYLIFLVPPFYKNFNKTIVKRPKLYFTDTGLAINLLGIRSVDQLNNHPLRGNLFEALVVSELHKKNLYNGEQGKLYFWRDKTGHEVDLIWDKGGLLLPIEIKSGKTIQPDFIKGLTYWNKISDHSQGTVLYAGEQEQHYSNGIRIVNWKKFIFE